VILLLPESPINADEFFSGGEVCPLLREALGSIEG